MSKDAPGRLELVQAYINSVDLEQGTDSLGSPDGLRGWLVEHRLLPADAPPAECDGDALDTAVALREALRGLCLVNNGEQPGPDAMRAFERTSAKLHLHLTARFGGPDLITLEPDEDGLRRALAVILTIVFDALHDGTWSRLKACASDSCQWAFYDYSRNRSGHWCTMAECGNRAKVRSYRARQAPLAG